MNIKSPPLFWESNKTELLLIFSFSWLILFELAAIALKYLLKSKVIMK
jgi:hypothetical protein